MAFLFKSKKNQDRNLSSREGPPVSHPNARIRDEKNGSRSTPTGSLNSFDEGSPGKDPEKQPIVRRGTDPVQPQQQQQPVAPQSQSQPQPAQAPTQSPSQQVQQQQQTSSSDLPLRNGPPPTNPNASLYPWSTRRLAFTSNIPSPFPRYGAAVNSVSSKEGDIYIMGGLINSSTVKGDLWMVEAGGSMTCYPLATTAEGPGPRVGHASLLVGNAFIVYGGDTKIDESDVLDETLYLLNTSTRQWSRALPSAPRPSGRYGHSLNIVGSKIYIFGGQVEGFFMNDLAAFDLNQLQMPNNRWEMIQKNSDSQAQTKQPPARTNHSVITYNDKLYLFGGTNGFQWFNDVWCFDPALSQWSQLDCIGYIPVPREGHAACLVDDVMYIFGGRTEDGADLGDLAAFRITSRRWYTFQNMGPSPSPRSGHSMTTVGKSVVVVGGEPSTATNQVNDLSVVYVLDTSKIRYPNDAQIQSTTQKLQQNRRPSTETPPGAAGPHSRPSSARDREGSNPPDRRVPGGPGAQGSPKNPPNGAETHGPPLSNGISKLPRAAGNVPPSGPPPQGPPPPGQAPKPTANANRSRNTSIDRNPSNDRSTSIERIERDAAGQGSPVPQAAVKDEAPAVNGRRTPNQQPLQAPRSAPKPESARIETVAAEAPKPKDSRQARGQSSVDSSTEPALKAAASTAAAAAATRSASPPPPTRQISNSNPINRRGSNRNSQTVALLKELDSARNRNAWYASELELARKSGYASTSTSSPALDGRGTETFDDDDKPLVEALLAMRQELANVQTSIDKQAVLAAKQIAEAEKQRDNAIREAVYAKAKLAGHNGSAASTPQIDNERDADGNDRSVELSRKLATAINLQKDLQNGLARANTELDAEKRARQLSDDTTTAAQKRMSELESYKQKTAAELERLKSELHMAQREAREQSMSASDASSALQLLTIEKDDLEAKYNSVSGNDESSETLDSLRAAVASSNDMRSHLERKLDEERSQREGVQSQLNQLRTEHETRGAQLASITQKLRDAEELAEHHAAEARTHRQAVLTGLDKVTKDSSNSGKADAERVIALQGQLAASKELVQKYQVEADSAADRLRAAEERIAGLEAYQEQSSREGVTVRRQLQSALKDTQSLQAQNSDLRHQLQSQQLEANAISVQHNTLKDILGERGISPNGLARARGMAGSRTDSPDQARAADLERQLSQAIAAHEETKQAFSVQANEADEAYRERVAQLENDYQSAVHYVKGTEKMLKKMKEELSRHKADNARLKTENMELEDRAGASGGGGDGAAAEWQAERSSLLSKIEMLEQSVQASASQLEQQMAEVRHEIIVARQERDNATRASNEAENKLSTKEGELAQIQQENSQLEKRAQDAEQKVSLLLDQVENSVDTYRRQSRRMSEQQQAGHAGPMNGMGHTRQDSSEAESLYGGMSNRDSQALDNLASELDMLRSHWEATSKNYRLSTNFDFEAGTARKDSDTTNVGGLSESLADWRKRLDNEEEQTKTHGPKGNHGS